MSASLASLLVPLAVVVIAAAGHRIMRALRESDRDRARTYPLGSPERRMLEAL